MKKTLLLSEQDIKAVMAEKFGTDTKDVTVRIEYEHANAQYDPKDRFEYIHTSNRYEPKVSIVIESEVQNYDL